MLNMLKMQNDTFRIAYVRCYTVSLSQNFLVKLNKQQDKISWRGQI